MASAVQCSGTLTGSITNSVTINGGLCTLSSAIISGSVIVSSGGALVANGATVISGNLELDGAGDVLISGTTSILGSINSSNSPTSTLKIESDAMVGGVEMNQSGDIIVSASVSSILSDGSGTILIDKGKVRGGGISKKQGSGDILFCEAEITGPVSVIEVSSGRISTASPSCRSSTVTGSLLVEKSVVDVLLTGLTLTSGDVIIVELVGSVQIDSSLVSDISMNIITGNVNLNNVETDSDVGIGGISGSLSVTACTFQGDSSVSGSGSVTFSGCSFGGESVSVTGNSGPVRILNNEDGNIEISENESVEIIGNKLGVMSVNKNGGGVSISTNTITELSCVDNSPVPSGSGNQVVNALGQCAGF